MTAPPAGPPAGPPPGPPPGTPRSVEELKAAMTAVGLHADEVNRDEDPQARRDEAAVLVRTRPDGGCDVVTMGRGTEGAPRHFASEPEAMADLAARLLHRPPVRVRTEQEREADRGEDR